MSLTKVNYFLPIFRPFFIEKRDNALKKKVRSVLVDWEENVMYNQGANVCCHFECCWDNGGNINGKVLSNQSTMASGRIINTD